MVVPAVSRVSISDKLDARVSVFDSFNGCLLPLAAFCDVGGWHSPSWTRLWLGLAGTSTRRMIFETRAVMIIILRESPNVQYDRKFKLG